MKKETKEVKGLDIMVTERNIVILVDDPKQYVRKSDSKLILPETADLYDTMRSFGVTDHPVQGVVMACGPKCEVAKVGMKAYIKYPQIFRTQHINDADRVITNPIGMQLDIDGIEYRHMGEYEVLCFRNKK